MLKTFLKILSKLRPFHFDLRFPWITAFIFIFQLAIILKFNTFLNFYNNYDFVLYLLRTEFLSLML